MSILANIVADKRREVAERQRSVPLAALRERVRAAPPPRSLMEALVEKDGSGVEGRRVRVIAEVKKASPSRGVIRADFDPVAIARAYERAGAAAVSVLTDEKYFQGSLEHLEAIRRTVSVPLLRKDFIIDAYQLWEARVAGADAVLLIIAALADDRQLEGLAQEARDLGMEVLWEVHDEGDLRRAVPFAPRLVGINNRDLRTFEVNLETTRRLIPGVPAGVVTVSESGFRTAEDLERLRGWGVGAFLIGESLMRSPDPGQALGELLSAVGGKASRQESPP